MTLSDPQLALLPAAGTGHTVRYGILVRDRRGRPSPLVVGEDLVVLEPMAAPGSLRGEPTAQGIRLFWDTPPGSDTARYNLYRPSGRPTALDKPINAEPVATTEYLDTTVDTGATYTYFVRAVLADGRPYREGDDSATIVELPFS